MATITGPVKAVRDRLRRGDSLASIRSLKIRAGYTGRAVRALLLALPAALLLASCSGHTIGASNVTSSSATLNWVAKCDVGPCQTWARYRTIGAASWNTTPKIGPVGAGVQCTSSSPCRQSLSGLPTNTAMEYQACGSDYTGPAPSQGTRYEVCVGPDGKGTSTDLFTTGWTRVVNDQFNSGGVPSHWNLYDGPYGSGAHQCAAPSHVTVSGGQMHIRMSYEPYGAGSAGCGPGWYTGGMQIDKGDGGADQQVTMRFRIVDSGVSGHHILPMRYPDTGSTINGEEDYCESGTTTDCSTFLHYGSAAPGSQIQHAYTVDFSQWHTLRFQRRNYVVRAYIDNLATPVWTYLGSPTTLPGQYNRTVLQQECHSAGCPSGTSGTEDIQIDWITIDDPSQ